MLSNLKGPTKGLIGPWAHKYPHFAKPGPQIGFLQECIRWWDQWLKGKETGIMDEPMLRVWMQDPAPPAPYYDTRAGRWVAEQALAVAANFPTAYPLHEGRLGEAGGSLRPGKRCRFHRRRRPGSRPANGALMGCSRISPSISAAKQAASWSSIQRRLPMISSFLARLSSSLLLSVDKPNALLAVTLCEVLADGAVARISMASSISPIATVTKRQSRSCPARR